MRRAVAAALGAAALVAGGLVGASLGQSSPRVLTLKLRTLDLVLQTKGFGETQTQSATQVKITLAADVLFRFNSAQLSAGARSILAGVAGEIRQQANGPVFIDGYTDSKGSPGYNIGLSNRRANAVEQALASTGARFVVTGHGEADPVAPNTNPDGSDNPAGRAKNRRVTVRFARR
jgi:OmpA-OmpF porin, OOP family